MRCDGVANNRKRSKLPVITNCKQMNRQRVLILRCQMSKLRRVSCTCGAGARWRSWLLLEFLTEEELACRHEPCRMWRWRRCVSTVSCVSVRVRYSYSIPKNVRVRYLSVSPTKAVSCGFINKAVARGTIKSCTGCGLLRFASRTIRTRARYTEYRTILRHSE